MSAGEIKDHWDAALERHPCLAPSQDNLLYEELAKAAHSHSTKAESEEEGDRVEQNVRACKY